MDEIAPIPLPTHGVVKRNGGTKRFLKVLQIIRYEMTVVLLRIYHSL